MMKIINNIKFSSAFAILIMLSVVLCSGCLMVSSGSKKEIVLRQDEPRKVVKFDSENAGRLFNTYYESMLSTSDVENGGSGTLVVFLIMHVENCKTRKVLSKNAVYNDCVVTCDLNKDGIITETEMDVFSNSKK